MREDKSVFISGALSRVSGKVRLEVFYDMIEQLCISKGFDVFLPYRDANPDRIPGMTNRKLYLSNMDRLKNKTNLLIAYVGLPSIGVGMEVEAACNLGVDVILLAEAEVALSKPLQGCPAIVATIRFEDFDDAISQLAGELDHWLYEYPQGCQMLLIEMSSFPCIVFYIF